MPAPFLPNATVGIRGVLFDSGGVLIRPVGGRWNPRFDFEAIVRAHHPDCPVGLFPAAFEEGQRVLDAGGTTVERAVYHRSMLRVLGIAEPSPDLLTELEAPPKTLAVEVYPDARPALDALRAKGIAMSVVSDAWAELPDLYRALGIDAYFAGFAISEVLGCRKPDPRMYRAGSDLLGLEPADCLFIDDDAELVEAAIRLGYRGVALVRDGVAAPTSVPTVSTLDELVG